MKDNQSVGQLANCGLPVRMYMCMYVCMYVCVGHCRLNGVFMD